MRKVVTDTFNEMVQFQEIGELTVPALWTPKWVHGPQAGQGYLVRPEYAAKDTELGHPEVKHGRYAAAMFNTSHTHSACLVRRFQVMPGPVKVSAWGMLVSDPEAGHGITVGIDPYGNDDWFEGRHQELVKAPWFSTYPENPNEPYGGYKNRKWVHLVVEAMAISNVIAVYMISENQYRKSVVAHWDYVEMWDSGPESNDEAKLKAIHIRGQMDELIAML